MCGHSKRRSGFVRYGLARSGKVKLTNDPVLANQDNSSDDKKISKYSQRNIRKQYEKVSNRKEEEVVQLTIEKFEFGLEKQVYNEMKDKFYHQTYSNGKNHKKWQRNHRDCYSNREIVFE